MINVSKKVVEEYGRLHQTAMLVFDPPLMDSPAFKSDALLFQALNTRSARLHAPDLAADYNIRAADCLFLSSLRLHEAHDALDLVAAMQSHPSPTRPTRMAPS